MSDRNYLVHHDAQWFIIFSFLVVLGIEPRVLCLLRQALYHCAIAPANRHHIILYSSVYLYLNLCLVNFERRVFPVSDEKKIVNLHSTYEF